MNVAAGILFMQQIAAALGPMNLCHESRPERRLCSQSTRTILLRRHCEASADVAELQTAHLLVPRLCLCD